MSMKDDIVKQLVNLLGDRVRIDDLECKLYSHDVGDIPKLMKPFLPVGKAGAVVRPRDERELKEILKIASNENLPVVARGASTSGYGGVLPMQGAIVIDMLNFSVIKDIDKGGMTVTVGAAAVWENIERMITKEGLMLVTYPSSAPSSTVGGWLAQGGYGYGAYEYGAFKSTVASVRVMTANGDLKTYADDELTAVSDAEGITGIIIDVTLKVRQEEEILVKVASFPTSKALMHAMKKIYDENLKLWSASFINPASVKLKHQMPPKLKHGHPLPNQSPEMPVAYIAIFAFTKSNAGCVDDLVRAIESSQGAVLGDDVARHEWEERFNVMKVKRIAPSLIPTEVIIPLDKLDEFLMETDAKLKQPLIIEGMVTRDKEVVILGFIPHDVRTFGYNLAFALALTVIETAKRLGGRAYSTGLYFKSEAGSVLGRDKMQKIQEYKKTNDPRNILNPGKIFGRDSFSSLLGFASKLEPVIRVLANAAKAPVGERFKSVATIPADIAWYAYACAQCGYCVRTCDQFYGRGWESESPRGKWYFLREVMEGREQIKQKDVSRFLACTTCEECNVRCQLDLPNESSWMKLRGQLVNDEGKMTFPPFEMMAASLRSQRNIWAQFSTKRADWVPEDLREKIKDKAEVAYFAGCTASFVEQDIAQASLRLLDKAGVELTIMGEQENCCGIPMLVSGRWDIFEEIIRHNISKMSEKGVKTVVTSCPACWLSWHTLYPEWAEKLGIDFPFKAKHYTEILAEQLKEGKFEFDHEVKSKVAFHDSCHIGRAGGIYEPPRELLKAVPGTEFVEMEHNREDGLCCGSVLTLIDDPPIAAIIGEIRIQEAIDIGVDQLLALCPCCQVQMRVTNDKKKLNMPINDLASYLAKGLGIEVPSSKDYALEMWAVFERFIYMMKPRNMADLMQALMPDMMAAMPGALRGVMKGTKAIPGWESIMKVIMPLIIPKLVPILMPKVMPQMLAEVEKRTGPLPEDMLKQMPDLLPKTMEALMPNMLPLIMEYIVPMMIECIKEPKCLDHKPGGGEES